MLELWAPKDYIIHELKQGESYFDFFNLPIPAPKDSRSTSPSTQRILLRGTSRLHQRW
jgi:hypothetical protein